MTIVPLLLAMTASLLGLASWTQGRGPRRQAEAASPTRPRASALPPGRAKPHTAVREPSGGHMPRLAPRPVMLGPVIERAIGAALGTVSPGLRHWQVDPALRDLAVRTEPAALEEALGALLRRAALHTRDGDIISLRWAKGSDWVALVVEDEGDGLFNPADASGEGLAGCPGEGDLSRCGLARKPCAFGEGCEHETWLSGARRLAAMQGGNIRIEAAPGIGARAWLTLPREKVLGPA